MRLRISRSLLALPLLLHQHAAQDCFFPDGSVAPDSSSCSTTSTGQCCPLNWQCLSNGLCWLETESFFGRYSCTDQAWQSASCPQICTHNLTAGGNEAVRQCPDGRYCCDGDRSFDCCDTANANYFALPPGSAYASVTAVASPTTASSLAASSVTSSGLSSASSSSSASTTAGPAHSLLSSATFSITSTNAAGYTVTIVSVATAQPSSPTPTRNRARPPDLSLIISLVAAIPIAALLAVVSVFLWCRHRKRIAHPPKPEPPLLDPNNPDMRHSYGHFPPAGHAPELDSYPVAAVHSASSTELDGSPIPNSSHKSSSNDAMGSPAVSALSSPRFRSSPLATVTTQGQGKVQSVNEHPVELWGGFAPARALHTTTTTTTLETTSADRRADEEIAEKTPTEVVGEKSMASRQTRSTGSPSPGDGGDGLGVDLPAPLRIGRS